MWNRYGKSSWLLLFFLIILNLSAAAVPSTSLTLYYTLSPGVLGVEVRQVVPAQDMVRVAVEELLRGPEIPGLYTQIPPGTKLRTARVADGTAYLDFDSRLVSYGGGTARELGIVAQIVYTVTELPGITQVQILVNGQTLLFPEGTATYLPLKRGDVLCAVVAREDR